ncbi:uncharacterized protein [Anabrus simplex]|uniref:uncharacterized protein isoform X2 n=1 Tax=Anabrus simplex TaxID=316456 RepID=UPI0035A324A2
MAAERQRPNLDSCRLCLAEGPDQIKIFSDRGLQLKIAETINKLFPFKVERNDGFPHNACYKCLHKLILYENLRRTFQWSTSVLDGYRNVRPVPGILTEDDSDDSGVEDGNVAGGSDLHDNLDSSTDRLPSSSTNNNDNDVGCSTGNQPSTSVQNNDVQKPDCQPSTSVQNNDVPNAGCQASSTTNTIDVDNQVETDNSNRHKSLTVTKGDTRSSASLDMPGSLQPHLNCDIAARRMVTSNVTAHVGVSQEIGNVQEDGNSC